MESQEKQLLKLFKNGIRLTRLKAMLYHSIGNLPARVERLRHKMGVDVKGDWIRTPAGKRVIEYYIEID